MTRCPAPSDKKAGRACLTHVGVDRDTCGSCGATIKRDTPTGPATHAYVDGRVVFMRRSNCSREAWQGFTGLRAMPSAKTQTKQTLHLDLLGHREDKTYPIGNLGFGGRGAA